MLEAQIGETAITTSCLSSIVTVPPKDSARYVTAILLRTHTALSGIGAQMILTVVVINPPSQLWELACRSYVFGTPPLDT